MAEFLVGTLYHMRLHIPEALRSGKEMEKNLPAAEWLAGNGRSLWI
jgi:hypothetical protein